MKKIFYLVLISLFFVNLSYAQEKHQSMEWINPSNNEILFTINDIIRFDWEKQIFELRRGKAMELMAKVSRRLQVPFIIKANDVIIYEGCFMSSLSSMSSHKPTITDGLLEKIVPPMYKISAGYPSDKFANNTKERFNPVMFDILKSQGKITDINNTNYSLPIKKIFSGWHGEYGLFQIAIEIFPETFRIGKEAEFHLIIAKSNKFELKADRIELQIILTCNNSQFFSNTINNVPLRFLDGDEGYIFKGKLWGPNLSSIDPYAKSGSGNIAAKVVAYKSEKKNSFEPIGAWKIPSIKIDVLPKK